jgi:hypothetical protein
MKENKAQVTIPRSNFAYRYTSNVFEVKYISEDTVKGENSTSINIKEYGWEKSSLAAVVMAVITKLARKEKLSFRKEQITEIKEFLLDGPNAYFSEDLLQLLKLPMKSVKEQDVFINKFAKSK